jgi:1,2-phenylacetyl-CoA epoxidase catalytic subunit
MFGRTGSKRSDRYIHWGLKRRANEVARKQYIEEVKPIIEGWGLKVPDPNKGRQYM